MKSHSETEESRQYLEWPAVCRAVQSHCKAVVHAADRGPLTLEVQQTQKGAELALEQTRAALKLLREGAPLPTGGVLDIAGALARVHKEGFLAALDLRDIRITLGAARVTRRYLSHHKERALAIAPAVAFDPSLDALEDHIGENIDNDGAISDHANPTLRDLRKESRNLRDRIVRKLEDLIAKHSDVLSDQYYTEREGRYVLPMRADAHDRISGIVHGSSASGATLFVEPDSLLAMGNRLRVAQAEVAREEQRVLAGLSEEVRNQHAELGAAYDSLLHLDLLQAKARFGEALQAHVLVFGEDGGFKLRRARHPLLALAASKDTNKSIVANDIALAHGHALVISGPNAGGKTVTLKLLGLYALMMRAGLPIAAEEDSEVGFYTDIIADIGDAQSLQADLSTFAGHMQRVAAMIERASPATLILVDELASGTDPVEGQALAAATVQTWVDAGATVAVTTHFDGLKAFAAHHDRVNNASVGFDRAALAPTFQLHLDVPGSSCALTVAERYGVPQHTIELAMQLQDKASAQVTTLLADLEQARDEARRAAAESAHEQSLARAQRDKAAEKAERERQDAERILESALAKLREQRKSLRELTKELRKSLREAPPEGAPPSISLLQQGEAALKESEAFGQNARNLFTSDEPTADSHATGQLHPSAEDIATGDRVRLPELEKVGTVVGKRKGQVQVAMGALRLWKNLDEVQREGGTGQDNAERAGVRNNGNGHTSPQSSSATHRAPTLRTKSNTVDLRGLRADEARSMLASFVDRMFGQGSPTAYIMHGVGTGALRDTVEGWLKENPTYVSNWKQAAQSDGGAGVTVAMLAVD